MKTCIGFENKKVNLSGLGKVDSGWEEGYI